MEGEKGPRNTFPHPTGLWSAIWSGRYNVTEVFELESDVVDWATSLSLFTFMHWRRKWQPTPVFLPGESQGWGAWLAAIYGIVQSRTRLKRLSSSSSSSGQTDTPWKSVSLSVLLSKGRRSFLAMCSQHRIGSWPAAMTGLGSWVTCPRGQQL